MPIAPELEQLLLRTNQWLFHPTRWDEHWLARQPDPYIARQPSGWQSYFPENKVTLVVGPRQAGKSTFLWAQTRDLGPRVLLVNCEEPLFRSWCQSPALFWGDVKQYLPELQVVIFEEVQHLDEAALFLKGLVDLRPNCPVLATGSSSFHLMSRTRESLAGRACRLRILPFSLAEVNQETSETAPLARNQAERENCERMLTVGGYPEAWLADSPQEVLGALVEGVVVRDASDLFRIDQPEAFRRLLKLMAGQVGNLVNLAEWAAICGISAKTVARYASILAEAHVVTLLRPFVSGKRAELTGSSKVYFVDNGIRNTVLARFAPLDRRDDVGVLWENWTYGEIIKNISPLLDTVGFWRTRSGAEVDFVVERAGRTMAIEVKARAGRPVLSRSSRSFIDAVQPDLFVTLYQGSAMERTQDGCRVVWAHPVDLPAILSGFGQTPAV